MLMTLSRLLVSEVHNFGGFFGGDTVTLSGAAWPSSADTLEQTLTIDAAALSNVPDRHTLVAGMLLELSFAGERVERATLLGAADYAALRRALGPPPLPPGPQAKPLILSHYCPACTLWVVSTTPPARCPLCATPLD
jgi:hypothetical protein